MILQRMQNRMTSDRGEPTSTSIIMWVAITVVIVTTMFVAINAAMNSRAAGITACLGNSNLINVSQNCTR